MPRATWAVRCAVCVCLWGNAPGVSVLAKWLPREATVCGWEVRNASLDHALERP